ncbi:hypothetical protein [Gloeobacter morelensis]|uniref:HTH marR-type domain-containing protein n=1 Tax=Gloeobacter morelensis MG652769 TaxID=2781736 RepID=A0ABY3PQ89_9CYAN|nr:hypothetical protein [Gloeobacter morelensis]UFP95779.1 hypothetical protein ISF26_05980 [Gloeobacter morelensis MG652769]
MGELSGLQVRIRRKMNRRSLENLQSRQPQYEEAKVNRTIRVTDAGWAGIRELAEAMGSSVSVVVERLGRADLAMIDELREVMSAQQDSTDRTQ